MSLPQGGRLHFKDINWNISRLANGRFCHIYMIVCMIELLICEIDTHTASTFVNHTEYAFVVGKCWRQ